MTLLTMVSSQAVLIVVLLICSAVLAAFAGNTFWFTHQSFRLPPSATTVRPSIQRLKRHCGSGTISDMSVRSRQLSTSQVNKTKIVVNVSTLNNKIFRSKCPFDHLWVVDIICQGKLIEATKSKVLGRGKYHRELWLVAIVRWGICPPKSKYEFRRRRSWRPTIFVCCFCCCFWWWCWSVIISRE